ncbi:PREDICTED: pentatricopeptide repeat-containing protein At4g37170 [Camelina sativa]|uniref:Pentatricopeptide repeat-containing protein At4g37170 n=1 Tax=Camelina sativa TaxID=90675 RepID=A0ABM0UUX8_CAMSA|nr:PREDICTED: pentatricopeptide repeat-containing protein At4g37170 [Camelina sativa]
MSHSNVRKLTTFHGFIFKRNLSSSAFASQKSFSDKKFFNSNNDDVGVVERLCKANRFGEAIDVLCGQKLLREAVQLLGRAKKQPASTYCNLIQVCSQTRALEEGKKVHQHIRASGFVPGIVIWNRLLGMYAKCGSLVDARKVFDDMPKRDVCSWNLMVNGYAEVGLVDEARKLFDEMPERDSYSWTGMVTGYVKKDQPEEALVLYSLMQKVPDSRPNIFTVSSAVAAAAAIPCIRRGKEIHGHIVRAGLDSDEVLWSSLMDMYGKCGCIDEARNIFDKIVDKDVVSWSSMIDRYFKSRRWREGFSLFSELVGSSCERPNEYTFAGVLNACADLTKEELGKQVHGYMTRIGFDPYSFASSSLVDMYTKCGSIESAKHVVDGCPKPDLVSWTSLIGGYAQNGQPDEALKYFDLLLKSGTKPDHVTFVNVLSACTHAGLVEKGLEYFHSITEKHGLSHTSDHYTCLVDLLARSGRFEQLKSIISEMPMKPSKFLWASVLGGCTTYGNIELAEEAAQELFKIEPENPVTYVTMANIYAAAGKWEEEGKMRKRMLETGVTKRPGSSWTEIKRKRHVFIAADTSHPMYNQIIEFLCELRKKMKEEGYVPATSLVLHDVEDEQKEDNLVHHSEKLAVAFAILSTQEGTAIKVFKNLRSCVDCHSAIKFISKITKRKITVRDSTRFHCFENGQCSCRDYW